MMDGFDDDTHYCIKCNMMILGLDNYVTHRKSNCSKPHPDVELPKSPLPSQLLPPEDAFALKADDFFSSLELQSSAKKHPPTTGGKSVSGVLTRSKTSSYLHHKDLEQSKSGKNAWIGGHQLKELGGGDNHTKLIKAVDNLNRTATYKKPLLPTYEESDDESDELLFEDESESEDDVPPKHHTGGKWKPSSPVEYSWSVPPSSHTGGKWRPESKRSSPPPTHTKGKWKPASPSPSKEEPPRPSFTGGKWSRKPEVKVQEWDVVEFNVPPPTHTKGKWKPPEVKAEVKIEKKVKSKENNVKSEDHTKGKVKSLKLLKTVDDAPLRKSNGRVQYFCSPCNRRLASKIVYERHLKTDLHIKRQELEFDDSSSHLNTNPLKTKAEGYWPHTATAKDNKDTTRNPSNRESHRIRRKTFVKCEVCRSRVHRQLMGKHLISHYHCRKGDITQPDARSMVLDNIHSIVLQSPFQCRTCRFYCNTQADFLRHWSSPEHETETAKFHGATRCAFCKFQCEDNKRMLEHLLSLDHKEVISVINRSVPIVITKVSSVACRTCGEEFQLNVQLRKHCENENHPLADTATDTYQNRNGCDRCDGVFNTKIALQRHKRNAHKDRFYLCSICNVTFEDAKAAKIHRSSTEHRCALKKKNEAENVGKKCSYCSKTFEDIIRLKEHLKQDHPEFDHSCSLCGETFLIPQELSVHLRNKACTFSTNTTKAYKCEECPFSTDSKSEILFHKVLHGQPALPSPNRTPKTPNDKYKCPICEKLFVKASLRCHLRMHTDERPYKCNICNEVSFARKNNWMLHMKTCGTQPKAKRRKLDDQDGGRPFLCAVCGSSFKARSALDLHMTIHTGKTFKCQETDCLFSARTASELKIHLQTHSDLRPFKCQQCEYTGKSKKQLDRHMSLHGDEKKYKCPVCPFSSRMASHLKRHVRLHTGSKPFSCPHCTYKCNNLENLRKHVLSTNKHPGKCIYECKFCEGRDFQSNFAKEFRAHLVTKHPDVFQTGTEAASYVAGIYEAAADAAFPEASDRAKDDLGELEPKEPIILATAPTPGTSSSLISAPVIIQEPSDDTKPSSGLFPLYILTKDVDGPDKTESWTMVTTYGDSEDLAQFDSEEETLFEEI